MFDTLGDKLNATVGALDGLQQPLPFSDAVDISGVALTKLDGSAKGVGMLFTSLARSVTAG